ncbi:hypothetical protein ACOME3_010052 [Neoechinorhynchus agilis]
MKRAEAYMQLTEFDSAIQDYKSILALNPNNSLVAYKIKETQQLLVESDKKLKIMYAKMFKGIASNDDSPVPEDKAA